MIILPRLRLGITSDYEVKYIKPEDLFTHIFLAGSTGTGKTNLLAQWFQTAARYRVAKILIDPGGLAEIAYACCQGKCHFISADSPLSLNPMRANFQAHQIFNIIIESINQMINLSTNGAIKEMTPRMIVIAKKEFDYCWSRERFSLEALRDRIAIAKGDGQTRDGILSRLDMLLSDPIFKDIVCGNEAIDIGRLTEAQETLILDASRFSRNQMIFLGALTTNLVKAYFRFSPPRDYKPLLVFIDELYNFVSPDINITLREGRRYRVSFIMATQDFPRQAEDLIRIILSNAGTLLAFRVGNREAAMIQKEFRNLTVEEIQFPEKYYASFRTRSEEGIVKTSKMMPVKLLPKPSIERKPQLSGWFKLRPISPAA